MEIIQFPGTEKINKKAEKRLDIEKVSKIESSMLLGPVSITCRNCCSKSTLSLNGMIFKSLIAYCGVCGTEYTIKNPCFTNVPLKSNTSLNKKQK